MISSLKTVAYRHLKRQLLRGVLRPGDRISPDVSAQKLGISQTPVREAIGLLETDGLVEQRPHQGVFVCTPTVKEFAELWHVRILLESDAAARAARRIKPKQLAELERLFSRMRELARRMRDEGEGEPALPGPITRELAIIDASFHVVLLRAAGNARVIKIVDNLQILSRLMSYAAPVPVSVTRQMAYMVGQHGRILHAVRRKDAKAARAEMRTHLKITRALTLEALRTKPFTEGAEGSASFFGLGDSVRRRIRKRERGGETGGSSSAEER